MDKVIQVLFMIIMTVGILGLPLYYYLNSRKKRIGSEFEEEPENPVGLDLDELDPGELDTDDRGADDVILDGADYESEEINFNDTYIEHDSEEDTFDTDTNANNENESEPDEIED